MLFARTRAALKEVAASPVIHTPELPTRTAIEEIRVAAEAHRCRVLGAILADLATLPVDLLRRFVPQANRQAA